jgi:sugar phosphate isomerase/epimerase
MRVGIFAKTFAAPGGGLDAALEGVAACGVRDVQLNLSLLGGPSLPERLDGGAVAAARAALERRGLEAVALSGTYNMAHPDGATRAAGARGLATAIAAAPALGAGLVTLCTGSRDADDQWRAHPENGGAAAWGDMVASVAAALDVAEREGVVLGVEPEPGNVICDAAAARRLLDELRSPSLRIVLDAANLVAARGLDEQDRVLDEAFALLGDDVVSVHAKDLDARCAVVAAGRGGLDYAGYVARLRAIGFDGPLILHGLGAEEAAESVAFLEGRIGAEAPAPTADPRAAEPA